MARYALVGAGNTVENLVEWDGDTSIWSPPSGQTAVAIGSSCVGIGMTYTGSYFIIPVIGDELTTEEYWAEIRAERNALLIASDFRVLPDSPLSDSKLAEWKTYRQALRDLPANTSDPSDPTYPTKPS
tara:strand:+ start:1295 stop:1678 length:384 start_codon:yes stop_codon:yes gene_type:complete